MSVSEWLCKDSTNHDEEALSLIKHGALISLVSYSLWSSATDHDQNLGGANETCSSAYDLLNAELPASGSLSEYG